MWKVLILFVYVTIEALAEVSFENTNVNVKSAQKNSGSSNDVTYRLPNTTIPQMYSIGITFRDDVSFLGSVYIKINVLESTNMITLHSSVLILNTTLTKSDIFGASIAHTHDIDVEREFLLIKTTEEILKKDSILWLTVNYIGYISTSNEGVFRKSFTDSNGNISYYIATRTKPNYARRIFPSYDEPRFKAQFIISLNHAAQYKAISNIEEQESTEDSYGRRITVFNHTRYMPTYLIAFVIFDFNATEYRTSNNIMLRTFSNQIELENTAFGLETIEQALHMFEENFSFEIQYELNKLDQVALPFFNQCSVANYGIALYRENCLLYDPSINTIKEKESAALSIVNNVCHQVLDNRLTPSWWSTEWLFEGLCRFYEYFMTSKIYPEMVLEGLFLVDIVESALVYDSLSATHCLSHYEESPGGVRELYDTITYNKSASILRMFYHSLSETTFTKGLKIYLSKSSLNNLGVTFHKDIYDAWQRAANEDNTALGGYKVEELFSCWENQEGYPILFVERSYNNHRVRFTQKPFTMSSKNLSNFLWFIPVTYTSKSDSEYSLQPKIWLQKQKTIDILIDTLHPSSYFLVNIERIGYYRVQYDEANWMLISEELSRMDPSSNISPISRAMLMNDATIFLTRNMLRVRIFLELMKHLEHDIEYIPWLVATRSLRYMRLMVINGNSKLSDDFKFW
ncbi:aminopeptidase N-like isoform X2 [Chironomus tepperi]|uniref:aminopeptidase N-like isoform X2 n=1 Tax=Chironomus tepperi TaxID=113505 RepID=UPI00391F2425